MEKHDTTEGTDYTEEEDCKRLGLALPAGLDHPGELVVVRQITPDKSTKTVLLEQTARSTGDGAANVHHMEHRVTGQAKLLFLGCLLQKKERQSVKPFPQTFQKSLPEQSSATDRTFSYCRVQYA